MTLVVLALDALDSALVEDLNVETLKLETAQWMETVAHMRDEPYTPEAWATIATGEHPSADEVAAMIVRRAVCDRLRRV
jgi:hypothetical protein